MRPIDLALGSCSILLSSSLSAQSLLNAPVDVVRGKSVATLSADVVYQDGDVSVVRKPGATAESFDRLYLVRMPLSSDPSAFLEAYGEVLHREPGKFLLMEADDAIVPHLSGALHGFGLACGALLKLNPHSYIDGFQNVPTPVLPVEGSLPAVAAMAAQVDAERIRSMIATLSALPTRHHQSPTGRAVAGQLAERYAELAQGRDDVSIGTFSHGRRTPQESLIVRIEGESRPDELIIVGSHIDSIAGFGGGGSAPGADDNASGTSTNLEIFRILMASGARFERTIEIHGYAAEEIGLVGSDDMAGKYRAEGKTVVAMVQHDMNIYKAPGTPDKITFISNDTNAGLNDLLGKMVDTYVGMAWAKAPLTSGNSDHYSWHRNGYAAAFPFEDPSRSNPAIHTAQDTMANAVAYEQAAGFAKLGLAYLSHFAGLQQ